MTLNRTKIFDDAYRKLRYAEYDWPTISCVSMIEELSIGCDPYPNYKEYKELSEVEALCKIKKLDIAENDFEKYIFVHTTCMDDCWEIVYDDDFQDGDVVFAKSAEGIFIDRNTAEFVKWKSNRKWPASMFFGHGKFHSFVPSSGLKSVISYNHILSIHRRCK